MTNVLKTAEIETKKKKKKKKQKKKKKKMQGSKLKNNKNARVNDIFKPFIKYLI